LNVGEGYALRLQILRWGFNQGKRDRIAKKGGDKKEPFRGSKRTYGARRVKCLGQARKREEKKGPLQRGENNDVRKDKLEK